jgi:hypothetical protein
MPKAFQRRSRWVERSDTTEEAEGNSGGRWTGEQVIAQNVPHPEGMAANRQKSLQSHHIESHPSRSSYILSAAHPCVVPRLRDAHLAVETPLCNLVAGMKAGNGLILPEIEA